MEDVGRAYERSETKGFMKIVVDAETRRTLGAALLGIGGDEIVQGLLDLIYAAVPYTVIQRTMHDHPTVYEMIPVMLEELRPLPPNERGLSKPCGFGISAVTRELRSSAR